MENKKIFENIKENWKPTSLIILYLLSLQLPYLRLPSMAKAEVSGWYMFVQLSFYHTTDSQVIKGYDLTIALVVFLASLVSYLILRKKLGRFTYLIVGISVLAALYLTFYLLIYAALIGYQVSMTDFFRLMNWGYYLSAFFSFAGVIWILSDSYQIREHLKSVKFKLS